MKCKDCGKNLVPLNLPMEECLEYKFIIKIPFTDWKFCLIKEYIYMGCQSCGEEERERARDDNNGKIYDEGRKEGYERAMEERIK